MPRRPSVKQCLASGYAHVESANFWAALGDRAEEQFHARVKEAALKLARDCFRQPTLLALPGYEKAAPLLKQVEARLRKMRQASAKTPEHSHLSSPPGLRAGEAKRSVQSEEPPRL